MKTSVYLITSILLASTSFLLFEQSQYQGVEKLDSHQEGLILNKVPLQPIQIVDIEPVEEIEVEPYPIIWVESKPLKDTLEAVTISTRFPHRCGCAPHYQYFTIEMDSIEEDLIDETLFAEPIYIDPYIFETNLYPNPAINETHLAIDIDRQQQFEIQLYDLNGRLIENIHSGELYEGVNRFDIDLYDLTPGMYLVSVRSETQQETLKVQKLN